MTIQQIQSAVKSSVNFSSNLNSIEREFIIDYKSKKLAEYDRIEVERLCREICLKAFVDTGSAKVGNELLKITTSCLLTEILPYKQILSPIGLKIAIETGVRKEYGEYYGINAVSFNMFLKGYMNSQERLNAVTKQKQHETKLANDRRAVETMDAAKEFTKYCYDKYKEQNVIWDPAQTAYDWLKKKRLIKNFTKELKNSIRAEAESRYMNFKMNGDNKGVPASQQVLDRIAGKPKEKLSYEQEITNLCKMLHLRIIFDQLTLEEIENVM